MFLKIFVYFQETALLRNVLCQWLLLPLLNKSMFRGSFVYRQRHFDHLLKTPSYIALLVLPDDYETTVNRKENANVLMFLLLFHLIEKSASFKVQMKGQIESPYKKFTKTKPIQSPLHIPYSRRLPRQKTAMLKTSSTCFEEMFETSSLGNYLLGFAYSKTQLT